MCSSEKKKKKKNPEIETAVALRPGSRAARVARGPGVRDLGSRAGLGRAATQCDPGHAPAWVALRPGRGLGHARPRSRAAWSCLSCISISYSSLSFCWSTRPGFFCCLVINNNYFQVRNRVLETRFPCRCHVEKVPHQT